MERKLWHKLDFCVLCPCLLGIAQIPTGTILLAQSKTIEIFPKAKQEIILVRSIGHYWWLLKIIVNIKTDLVMSNGELLIVKNIVRNDSLWIWSNVVFEKVVISHENIWFDFETSAEVWKSSIWTESTQLRTNRVFSLPLFSHNFEDQLSSNFHRFVLCAYFEIHQVRRLVSENITKGVQCQWSIFGIQWFHFVNNNEVTQRTCPPPHQPTNSTPPLCLLRSCRSPSWQHPS